MEDTFTHIYENSGWGDNGHSEYKGSSGWGSDVQHNKDTYVAFLKRVITDNNLKNIVDLGFGDFRCGRIIYDDLDVMYTGYDTYKGVVDYNKTQYPHPKFSFMHLDFCNQKEEIVSGDLCILKDVLQHWPTKDIYGLLDYLVENKKFKYILICNCCNQTQDNGDTELGGCRELSCDYLPLKKYNPIKLYRYNTKEVSVIQVM